MIGLKKKWYKFLTKIGVVKELNYKDVIERNYNNARLDIMEVTSKLFIAEVFPRVFSEEYINIHYYYRLDKMGERKILFVINNERKEIKKMTCALRNIRLKLDEKIFDTENNMPRIRRIIFEGETPKDIDDIPVKELKYEEVVYSMELIKDMRYTSILSSFDDDEIGYTYFGSIKDFEDRLNKIRLRDLESYKVRNA